MESDSLEGGIKNFHYIILPCILMDVKFMSQREFDNIEMSTLALECIDKSKEYIHTALTLSSIRGWGCFFSNPNNKRVDLEVQQDILGEFSVVKKGEAKMMRKVPCGVTQKYLGQLEEKAKKKFGGDSDFVLMWVSKRDRKEKFMMLGARKRGLNKKKFAYWNEHPCVFQFSKTRPEVKSLVKKRPKAGLNDNEKRSLRYLPAVPFSATKDGFQDLISAIINSKHDQAALPKNAFRWVQLSGGQFADLCVGGEFWLTGILPCSRMLLGCETGNCLVVVYGLTDANCVDLSQVYDDEEDEILITCQDSKFKVLFKVQVVEGDGEGEGTGEKSERVTVREKEFIDPIVCDVPLKGKVYKYVLGISLISLNKN